MDPVPVIRIAPYHVLDRRRVALGIEQQRFLTVGAAHPLDRFHAFDEVTLTPGGDAAVFWKPGESDIIISELSADSRRPLTLPFAINAAAWSPDGRTLALVGKNQIWLWDRKWHTAIPFTAGAPGEWLVSVGFSRGGDEVSALSNKGSLSSWHTQLPLDVPGLRALLATTSIEAPKGEVQ